MLNRTHIIIGNAIWFQLCWLFAVLVQNPYVLCLLLLAHFIFIAKRIREIRSVAVCAFFGISIDTLLAGIGFFQFPDSALMPTWLVSLWFCFASTLGYSLSFLHGRTWLASLLGAIGGPLSYFAGARLGAVTLAYGDVMSLAILGLIWAALMPVLLNVWHLSEREAAEREPEVPEGDET